MPVSVFRSPFTPKPTRRKPRTKHVLRTAQARVLQVLLPADIDSFWIEWPTLSLRIISKRAGVSAQCDYVRRALKGLREDSPSGTPHLGLLALGYVIEDILDIDGIKELNYRATVAGVRAYEEYLISVGGALPPVKKANCVNKRYRKTEDGNVDVPK